MEAVLTATVVAAEAALAKTPSLLPILREAGVVDAGGAGLARVFEGALRYLVEAAPARPESRTGPRPSTLVAHADDGFGYETMFLLQPRPGASLDVDAIRIALDAIGDSVLVAGDARAVKVHVHSERPDEVLRYGAEQGSLSRISVENLDSQARDVRERRAAEFAGPAANGVARETRATATAGAAVTSDPTGDPGRPPGATSAPVPLAVIAVAAGDGLAAVFASFGCTKVVGGGQGANPSTGELLAAVEEVNADHVLLLPNNPNVLLAARQVVDLSPRRGHRRSDPERRRGRRRPAGSRSRHGARPQCRGDDRARPLDPVAAGHTCRARRDDRRPQGEEGPGDRARSGRRAWSRPTTTKGAPSSRRSTR